MNALDVLLINSYLFFCHQKEKAMNAFRDEKGAVDIVAVVVMIGVVVVIAVLFRKQIAKLVNNLFEAIGKQTDGAIGGTEQMPEN